MHFFFHCLYYIPIRKTLFEEVKTINANLLKLPDYKLTDILLYGCSHFDENQNRLLLISSIEYIMNSKRFDGSLFWFGIIRIISIGLFGPYNLSGAWSWSFPYTIWSSNGYTCIYLDISNIEKTMVIVLVL